ncbi:hypothetical protein OSB04_004906, partial [Centaurea solstitialis]
MVLKPSKRFLQQSKCAPDGHRGPPQEPNQFALGLSDGVVHVFEPLESEGKWGVPPRPKTGRRATWRHRHRWGARDRNKGKDDGMVSGKRNNSCTCLDTKSTRYPRSHALMHMFRHKVDK